jgi:hypothetical protein
MGNQRAEELADPSLTRIDAALSEITERLARELNAPTDAQPPWDDFEWCIAKAVAAMQGVSSQLSASLRWAGPEGWRRFLAMQRDHVAARHCRIARLLERIDSLARREGIALVALKGAALHRLGVYKPGERPMADVDLLVRDTDVSAASRLLLACGYELSFTTWRHRLFESRLEQATETNRLGEHSDNPIKIELHTRIAERLPWTETDITRFVFPGAAHAGLNAYPSAASLMMHLLLHAAGNARAHALRLIQIHDIACLAARFSSRDWQELMSARPNERSSWWAVVPLMLTARYYPAAIPSYVITGLEPECPPLLRRAARQQRLADVSWTNLKIYAFPGIEWSRSLREALEFMISRIFPSGETRAELKRFAKYHPGALELPWYGISQAARMLRWLFSASPRVQALLPIRAALAQSRAEASNNISAKN